MKTAISLPDALYRNAEKTAEFLGISRSKLYSLALEEFLQKHNGEMIIKKINEVYEKIDQSEFDDILDAGIEALRELTKDDTW
ncbi:MAG: ChpI protein [Treponema sp.]|nr:ChpI protein [Treponema sp.]